LNKIQEKKESLPRNIEEIQQSKVKGLFEDARKKLIKDRETLLIRDDSSRKTKKLTAARIVLERNDFLKAEYTQSLKLIDVNKLVADIGAPSLTILRGKGKIGDEEWAKIEKKIGTQQDTIETGGSLKPKKEITESLAKKGISSVLWALLITLNIVDFPKAIESLITNNKEDQAKEVQNLLGIKI